MKDKVKDIFYSVMEDKYDCGAGSPGMSSVGNMGGNTNRGLRPLRKDEESKAKQFVINKMLKSS